MGTINYCTSDYITLAFKPYNINDFTNDPEWLDFIQNEWGIDINDENAIYQAAAEEINHYYEEDYCNIATELNKYYFYYFHVTIEPGYYEGFSINIENNFPICFDAYWEKRDAQKEITTIKQFLIDCAGCGMVECSPGWCTGYSNYKDTLKAINEAIKEMREEVKATPTWVQYQRCYT